MKSILVLSAVLVLVSCTKELDLRQSPGCIEMEPNANFETIPFKKDYTIQVPAGHTGTGLDFQGENVQFVVKTSLGSQISYAYSCATDCHLYFGESLPTPVPESITVAGFSQYGELIRAAEFCITDDVHAILFHSIPPGIEMFGVLYMNTGQRFEEGLRLRFDSDNMDEIEAIIRTIVHQ